MPTKSFFKTAAFYSMLWSAFFLPISMSLYQIGAAIFLLTAIVSWAMDPDRPRFDPNWVLLLAIYMIFNILSCFGSSSWAASSRGLFKVFRQILLCLSIFYVLDSRKKIQTVIIYFLTASFVVSVDGLVQFFGGFEILRNRKMIAYMMAQGINRITGPFKHAIDFSAYLIFPFFLFLSFMRSAWKSYRLRSIIFFGLFMTVLLCIILTFSRGAWIGIAFALVAMAVIFKDKLLGVFLVVAILWALFVSPAPIRNRINDLLNFQKGTVSERVELWGEAIRMIQSSPLTGLGVNTYAKNEPHFKRANSVSPDFQYAHNGYLQMAAEIGIFGLGSFILCMAYFLFTTIKKMGKIQDPFLKSSATALYFGVIAFLLHSATDTNLQSTLLINLLWFAIGLCMAASRLPKEPV